MGLQLMSTLEMAIMALFIKTELFREGKFFYIYIFLDENSLMFWVLYIRGSLNKI